MIKNPHILFLLPLVVFLACEEPFLTKDSPSIINLESTSNAGAIGTTYYVSSSEGIEDSSGTVSGYPRKGFWGNLLYLNPGDKILLKRGDTWENESLILIGSGEVGSPILISTYGAGANPIIKGHFPFENVNESVFFPGSNATTSYVFENIDFKGLDSSDIGISLRFSADSVNGNMVIRDCTFKDFGSGISYASVPSNPIDGYISNITVENSIFINNYHAGIRYHENPTNPPSLPQRFMENFIVQHNTFSYCGDFGIQFKNVFNGLIENNDFINNGNNFDKGSTAIYLGSSTNVDINYNHIHQSIRLPDNPDGCGIDLEVGNKNVTIYRNIIDNSYGAGILLYNNDQGSDSGNIQTIVDQNIFYNNNQERHSGKAHAEILTNFGTQTGEIRSNSFYLRYSYGNSEIEEDEVDNFTTLIYNQSTNHSGVLYLDVFDVTFDPNFYSDVNPDLRSNMGYNTNSLYSHWSQYGLGEGRIASPVFNVHYYYAQYPDLQQNIGPNVTALRQHFLNHGVNESRRGSEIFDVSFYKQNYSDVAGMSNIDAYKHFVTSGILEGRQGSSDFSAKAYLDRYADLENAFGIDYRRAISHYCSTGRNEGRTGAP